ncbi:MAG: LLM class flavin-dependent oxidoreductase [Bifidobacteriaceae bacterium]|jgi:alkanesulfonate monooxygenase SsuD/methylene tetrahydromethanopterin reductase-like flavin-dependent oxidoreductase (luciferase family)|nr:LLM class flavin-dependent oxidoreductase [Bifidobacteriaceae bacterium]
MNHATTNRRIYIGSELVSSVARFPSPIEFDDDDDDRTPFTPDLGLAARLARTAQRGVLDYICVDDTLAGNPPFSGRRRGGLDSIRLATRLATATEGIHLAPVVRSSRVEPSSLLEALVALEIASGGRHAWELQLLDRPSPMTHSGELLSAIVEDTWSEKEPLTKLAAAARALRLQRLGAAPDQPNAPGAERLIQANQGAARPTSLGGLDGLRTASARRPTLVMRADTPPSAALAAQKADIARISAASFDEAAVKRSHLQTAAARAGRESDAVKVLVDLTITLAAEPSHAEARKDLAEKIIGQGLGGGHVRYVGTPAGLAAYCVDWTDQGACDGFTFLPTSLPVDLILVVDGVTPVLAASSHFPSAYGHTSRQSTSPRSIPISRRPSTRERIQRGATPAVNRP